MEFQVRELPTAGSRELMVSGEITNVTVQDLHQTIIRELRDQAVQSLTLNFSAVTRLDTAGAVLLIEAVKLARAATKGIKVVGLGEQELSLLNLVEPRIMLEATQTKRHKPISLFEKIGEATLTISKDTTSFLTFVGEFAVEALRSAKSLSRIRWQEVFFYMERTGVDSIPIISLIGLLMGLILGFQAAIQLKQFGANIFVADLVGVSITRELGPLIAAIIVAGRSGSAFAAEIGTMKVSEEVAALEVMGFDRMRFLVMPKVIALVIMLPCLALLSDLVGIIGGLLVGIFQLDLSVVHYLEETRMALVLGDIFSGLIKSAVFAMLIAGIGCFRGFQVSTDAESVGRLTTSAVVSGIFLIIATDAAFTVVFYAMGF